MRERLGHHPLRMLLALSFLAGLALDAAAYERPTTEPPTPADMVLINGKAKTVVVQLLNLTPYTIVQDVSGVTAAGSLDKNRYLHKSFMFAPVGWPTDIPGLKGNWSQSGIPVFTPTQTNTSAHPYSFVVAWDDQGGYVTNSSMGWTVKGVDNLAHTSTSDIPLRLWFTRVKPPGLLESATFRLIASCVDEALNIIGVLKDPVDVLGWIDAITGAKELVDTGFEAANSQDTGGDKMYLAAYAIPPCNICSPTVITTLSGQQTSADAVDVQWASIAGDYVSNLVVTTHLLRGLDVNDSFDGKVPIAMITLWTPGQYAAAKTVAVAKAVAAAGQQTDPIHTMGATLETSPPDLSRYTQFELLYQSLNPSQQRTFHEALESLWVQRPLTQQQQVLLEKMAAAMEKGQTTIHPANR